MSAAPKRSAPPAHETLLVVGGGLPGLAAAHMARARGDEVRLIEAGPRLGGVNNSLSWNGFTLDFGCHLFGNEHDLSTEILLSLMKGEVAPVSPRTASVANGALVEGVEYPDLSQFGSLVSAPALLDLIETAATDAMRRIEGDENATLADWLAARYGGRVAELLSPMLRKMLRAAPEELSARASRALPVQRILLTSPAAAELLKQSPALDDRLVMPAGPDQMRFHRPNAPGYPARAFYPATGGMGGFTSRARDVLEADGVAIATEQKIISLQADETDAEVVLDGGETVRADRIVWTAGPQSLAELAGCPIESGALLHATPMVVFYFDIDRAQAGDRHYIQNFDPDDLTFRISVPSNYAPGVAPEGRAYLCCEATADLDGALWNDPDAHVQKAWSEASAYAMVSGEGWRDVKVLKTPVSYKLPKAGATQALAPLTEWLAEHRTVHLPDPFAFAKSSIVRGLSAMYEETD